MKQDTRLTFTVCVNIDKVDNGYVVAVQTGNAREEYYAFKNRHVFTEQEEVERHVLKYSNKLIKEKLKDMTAGDL